MTGRYGSPRTELTPREIAVLMLVAEGHTNSGIAGRLGITLKTVETHLLHIYEKMLGDGRRAAGKSSRVAVAVMYRKATQGGAA